MKKTIQKISINKFRTELSAFIEIIRDNKEDVILVKGKRGIPVGKLTGLTQEEKEKYK